MSAEEVRARRPDLCASYQQAVIDALLRKTQAALGTRAFASLGLSGGVANNGNLRSAAGRLAADHHVPLRAALPGHTGDNAGMIGFAAWCDWTGVDHAAGSALAVRPDLGPGDSRD